MALLLVVVLVLPVVPMGSGDEPVSEEPPTRYGFTAEFVDVGTPSSEAICVAAGDVDGKNNDDVVVGVNGAVEVYTNNGGSGQSLSFNPYKTISLAGYYITDVTVVDYDDDDDMDIIALGQDNYGLAGESGSGVSNTIGSMRIYYLENTGTGFTLEVYYEFDDTFYYMNEISGIGAWFWGDGKYDFGAADVDGDDDVDSIVIYNRDTDDDEGTGGEDIVIALLEYSSTGFTRSNITSISTPASWNINCFLGLEDFNMDGNIDIAYTYGGVSNNNWIFVQVEILFHAGISVSWGNKQSITNAPMIGDGTFPSVPYAMAVGDFAYGPAPDIIISIFDNQNVNPAYTDNQLFIIRKKNPALSGNEFNFEAPNAAYGEDYNFQFRGFGVGNIDNMGGDDLIGFTKQDDGVDENYYNAPTDYGMTILQGRSAQPVILSDLKTYQSQDGTLDSSSIVKCVAMGEFDGNTTYGDIVYAGNVIKVGTTSYPPNEVPTLLTYNHDPLPASNKDKICTFNITVEDLDGWYDLGKLTADFSYLGLPSKTIQKPTSHDPGNSTYGFYEFTMTIPRTVPQGNFVINLTFYDKFGSNWASTPKSTDTMIFRVKQYNREPVGILNQTERILNISEDQTAYFEDVYSWFEDLDIEQGYTSVPMNISMKTIGGQWLTHIDYQDVFKAELINGSAENPWTWTLKITPDSNFNHDLNSIAPDAITLRARDGGGLVSEEMRLKIHIDPVNDLPVIVPKGTPDDDFEFIIKQDDFVNRFPMKARDTADGDPEGIHLIYSFIYDDPDDEEWVTIDQDGIISWNPKNEHVGAHMVTLRVNDSDGSVEQILWFNVSNVIDTPYFISVANASKVIELPKEIEGTYLFTVFEHEEFNLTIVAADLDMDIGKQAEIVFQCDLTLSEGTYMDVDPQDPTRANLHFWAEKKYGYPPTQDPEYPAIETDIILVDEMDPLSFIKLPIRINIVNVNDPPVFVGIDSPEEGANYSILYKIPYSAEVALDPDTDLNDTLRYVWDFDASDGFQEDAEELHGTWDFPMAGAYMITLRVYDNAQNYIETTVNITVSGIADENDYDNDGMENQWELDHGFDPYDPTDAEVDTDKDQWSNLREFQNGTDPREPDTDNDGVEDGVDFDPLDPSVTIFKPDEESWIELNFGLFLVLLILAVLLVLALIGGVLFIIIRSNKKKAEEEEARRKQAEDMQESMYESQDLYSDLPPTERPGAPEVQAAPQTPMLPPSDGSDDLGDIFGGAGTLPSLETDAAPQQAALPEASQQTPAQPQAAPPTPVQSDDLSDLLD
ncbi:MAG: FG-GAP-like repeat-containing protein [Candidatus Thermoplasmatota archaeon]|nr:FG-GAP-like repeat-containing protein [Candidatus Thermoplasmatota archaeon]